MALLVGTVGGSKSISTSINHRAYADVHIENPATGAKSSTFQCLVDTGADHTILPISAAASIGLVPSGPPITFRAAGGMAYTLPSHSIVSLMIEGYLITTTVVSAASSAFIPIVGRLQLIQAFDIALSYADWYWD